MPQKKQWNAQTHGLNDLSLDKIGFSLRRLSELEKPSNRPAFSNKPANRNPNHLGTYRISASQWLFKVLLSGALQLLPSPIIVRKRVCMHLSDDSSNKENLEKSVRGRRASNDTEEPSNWLQSIKIDDDFILKWPSSAKDSTFTETVQKRQEQDQKPKTVR